MLEKYTISAALIVAFLIGCTTADIDPETYEEKPIFIGSCAFDVVHPGQKEAYWVSGRVALTSSELILFGPDSRNKGKFRKLPILLSAIDGIDLKGIGHGRQLQVKVRDGVIAIEVISSDFPTDKSAAQDLHDALVSLGVEEWKSKKLYPSPSIDSNRFDISNVPLILPIWLLF